jgi:hypothetical protein
MLTIVAHRRPPQMTNHAASLSPSRRRATWFSYATAALFTLSLARFALPPGSPLALTDGTPAGTVLALAPHLLLLVGVWPVLAAPSWAKAAGLAWFLIDMSSDLLALAGAEPRVFLTVRYIGHLFAAGWIAATASRGRGAFRWVGLALAVILGRYTLVAAWVPPIALAASGPLLIIWWVLVGRRFAHQATAE